MNELTFPYSPSTCMHWREHSCMQWCPACNFQPHLRCECPRKQFEDHEPDCVAKEAHRLEKEKMLARVKEGQEYLARGFA